MSDQSNISILIIEDDAVVALDIERRVRKLGYSVSQIKHRSDEAIDYLQIHDPDLILCDINMKNSQDGIDVANFNLSHNKIPLIFITAHSDRQTLELAKKTLPYGYIVKPFNNRDLLTAIELALYKYGVELERVLLTNDRLAALLTTELSDRELEILQDVVNGLTNQQICDHRYISVSTVKFHIGNIYKKMDTKNRSETLQKILQLVVK